MFPLTFDEGAVEDGLERLACVESAQAATPVGAAHPAPTLDRLARARLPVALVRARERRQRRRCRRIQLALVHAQLGQVHVHADHAHGATDTFAATI